MIKNYIYALHRLQLLHQPLVNTTRNYSIRIQPSQIFFSTISSNHHPQEKSWSSPKIHSFTRVVSAWKDIRKACSSSRRARVIKRLSITRVSVCHYRKWLRTVWRGRWRRGVRLLTFTNDRSFSVSEPRVAGYHKFKMADPLGGENKSHSGRASVEKSFHGYGDGGDGSGDGVGGQPFWSPFSRGGGYDEDFRGVAPPKMADPINRV